MTSPARPSRTGPPMTRVPAPRATGGWCGSSAAPRSAMPIGSARWPGGWWPPGGRACRWSPSCPRWAGPPTSWSSMAYGLSAEPQPRELDALLSAGEMMSCALAAMAVHELGERAVSLAGSQAGIVTDESARQRAACADIAPADYRGAGQKARSCWSPDSRACRATGTSRRSAGGAPMPPRSPSRRRSGRTRMRHLHRRARGIDRGPEGGAHRAQTHCGQPRRDAPARRRRRRGTADPGRRVRRHPASTSTCGPASPPSRDLDSPQTSPWRRAGLRDRAHRARPAVHGHGPVPGHGLGRAGAAGRGHWLDHPRGRRTCGSPPLAPSPPR